MNLLFLIGTSFALLANLYMPSNQAAIDHYHDVVEDQLKKILGRFAELLGKGMVAMMRALLRSWMVS